MASQPAASEQGAGRRPAAPTWDQVLADLELETAALQEGLRRGELLAPVTPWHPPVLPPIPPELVARAPALLEQQLRLQIQVALELDRAPAVSRARPASRPEPAPQLVDLRA